MLGVPLFCDKPEWMRFVPISRVLQGNECIKTWAIVWQRSHPQVALKPISHTGPCSEVSLESQFMAMPDASRPSLFKVG